MRTVGMSKVTTNGQANIPKSILQLLNVSSGDSIIFKEGNGKIILESADN